jgi:hypothetical protein
MMAGTSGIKLSKNTAMGTLTTTPDMKKNISSLLLGLWIGITHCFCGSFPMKISFLSEG